LGERGLPVVVGGPIVLPIVNTPSSGSRVRQKQRERNRDVLLEAWRIRRRAALQLGCPMMEIDFSECLKMAWELVKMTEKSIDIWKIINCKPSAKRSVRQTRIKAALNEWHPDRFHEATERVLKFSNRITRELICLKKAA
jgi:hypothetical protein